MFDTDNEASTFLVGVILVVACAAIGGVIGAIYAGQIGGIAGAVAGAFVGGVLLYLVARVFEAAMSNIVIVAPVIAIIAGAAWLYAKFF